MRAHKTGLLKAPNKFNQQNIWVSMKDYYQNLDQVSQSRWAIVLNFDDCDNTENDADESLLSAHRVNCYIPSSPVKP